MDGQARVILKADGHQKEIQKGIGFKMGTETWTYDSPTTVVMDGDYSMVYWPKMKCKFVQDGTTKYFIITDVSYNGGTTQTTITLWSKIYVLENLPISDHLISPVDAPRGNPDEHYIGRLTKLGAGGSLPFVSVGSF
jgi:hypothetical protein